MKATPSVFLQTGGSIEQLGGRNRPPAPPRPVRVPRRWPPPLRPLDKGRAGSRRAPVSRPRPRARAFALSPRESVPYFASEEGAAPRVRVVPWLRLDACHRAALLTRSFPLKAAPLGLGAARRRAGSRPTGRGERRADGSWGGWRDAGAGTHRAPDGAAPANNSESRQ